MASGTEIILGFPWKNKKTFKYFSDNVFTLHAPYADGVDIVELLKSTKLKNGWASREKAKDKLRCILEDLEEKFKIYEPNLIAAHVECLQYLFQISENEIIQVKSHGRIDKLICNTSFGKLEFYPFSLNCHLDQGEMEETLNELIIGVSISGRYRPTFLDYKSPCGTIHPIIFDKKFRNLMQLAKDMISEQLPIFSKALWCVKEMHY